MPALSGSICLSKQWIEQENAIVRKVETRDVVVRKGTAVVAITHLPALSKYPAKATAEKRVYSGPQLESIIHHDHKAVGYTAL